MPVSLVYLDIKPEMVGEFLEVTLENCACSRREAGNIAFHLLREKEDENKFVLFEHFRDKDAIEFHKTTAHYKKWAEMMERCSASPRHKTVYEALEPQ